MWWDFCKKEERREETYEDFKCSCYIEPQAPTDLYMQMKEQSEQELATNLGIMNMNIHR